MRANEISNSDCRRQRVGRQTDNKQAKKSTSRTQQWRSKGEDNKRTTTTDDCVPPPLFLGRLSKSCSQLFYFFHSFSPFVWLFLFALFFSFVVCIFSLLSLLQMHEQIRHAKADKLTIFKMLQFLHFPALKIDVYVLQMQTHIWL